MSYPHIKGILDCLVALIIIMLSSPVFLIMAFLIKLESEGPLLFRQKRVGRDKQYFYIFKFRSMRVDTPKDVPTHLLDNPEKYMTRIGRFLRLSSLDELPQLINIIRGEMSFVGPRPALWNQFDLISERDKAGVSACTPGLTGWAQINGRDELSIVRKVQLDAEYVNQMSFSFDLMVIFKTIFRVIKSEGVKEGSNENKAV